MSKNFKCQYCDYCYSSQNAIAQYMKYCKELNISTEESNNDTVSSINEMSLDSEDFSRIEEPSIREENLLLVSKISYQYESDSSYAGDISFHSSNISEEFGNFDEILSESLQNYAEKSDANMSDIPEEFENFDEPESLSL